MIKLMIGMIGSGKSTHCSTLDKDKWILCNGDSITNAIHFNDYLKYDVGLKDLYNEIQRLIIIEGVKAGKNVVVDRVNMTTKGRARFIGYAKELGCDIVAHHTKMELPSIHVSRRMVHDARGMTSDQWLKVAEHHLSIYERPTLEEGFKWISGTIDR